MEKTSYRKRYTFWLDIGKSGEFEIAENIEHLKHRRKFSETIRDGIRLICDLRQGRVEVLFELFPWIKESLQPVAPAMAEAADPAIKEQLNRLEKLMKGQGSVLIEKPSEYGRPSGQQKPKAMVVPQFEVPDFDDDDIGELVVRKDTSTNSAQNFLNSMMSLQQ